MIIRQLCRASSDLHDAKIIHKFVSISSLHQQIFMMFQQIAEGFSFFSNQIFFSDIQPGNIYLTRGGTVKLSNFINSRMIASERMAEECRTPDGVPDYMCAEKVRHLLQ